MTRFQKYAAELIGTFCLVTAGCGAIIVDHVSGGRLTQVGISLVFGLVVLAMIHSFGQVSGAHLNPAVTMGLFSVGRLPGSEAIAYVIAQITGAVLASLFLNIIFPQEVIVSMTVPAGPWFQSFALEFFMTFVLMLVIMGAEGSMAGVAIGGTICFEALFGGPISGGSMNPARSFGPALISGVFLHHWIYWIAPISASIIAAKLQEDYLWAR